MEAYILWIAAILSATSGTYSWFVRGNSYSSSWRAKHPRTVGTFFYGLALLLVVAGLDVRGVF